MARPAQKKADRRLASMVVARYNSAAWARRPREDEWWKARKRYDPSKVNKDEIKRAPFVKVPYVYRVTNSGTARYLQASKANGNWAVARNTTPEHGATGEIITNLLQRDFTRQGSDVYRSNTRAMRMFSHGGELYGNAMMHIRWFDHATDWGCKFTNIDMMDVFADWKEYRWVVLRRVITVAELGDIAEDLSGPSDEVIGVDELGEPILDPEPRDGGRALSAFKKVVKMVREGKRNHQDQSSGIHDEPLDKQVDMGRVDDNYGSDEESDDDPSMVRIEVLEYYETREDGIIAKVIPGFQDGEDLVLESGVNIYGVCPIVPFTPSPIDNEFYGYGVSEEVGGIAEAMDYNFRAALRLIAKSTDLPILHRRQLRVRRDWLAQPSGSELAVTDIHNDVGYMPSGVDAGAYPFALQLGRDIADLATGSSDAQRGQASGAKTATGDAIAEKGGDTNTSLKMDEWARSNAQIARVCVAMYKVHITTEKAIPLVGKNAEKLVAIKPEYLEGDFEVSFGGSTLGLNQAEEVTGIINFLQTLAPTGIANVPYLARELARKLGAGDPDSWVVAGANQPKVSPRNENYMVFKSGMEISVHPEDDDMAHMRAHQKEAEVVAGENPAHPGLRLMQDHYNDHQQAFMQKQQAMMMQGQAGGGSPMGMQNGAGQMQGGLNGQSANVEQMRQQPNQQAAGMAPGGATVPNRPIGSIATGGPQR